MNTTEEKPWILYFNSRGDTIQIDQEEYENLMRDLANEKTGAVLRNGSYVNLRIASIISNPHYVSPESIEKTKKRKELWYEFQDLKKQKVLKTWKQYVEWKKESIKNIKRFQDSLKKGEENEKKRTT